MLRMITQEGRTKNQMKEESKSSSLGFTFLFHLRLLSPAFYRLTGLVRTPVRLLSVVSTYGRLVCQYLPVESNQ